MSELAKNRSAKTSRLPGARAIVAALLWLAVVGVPLAAQEAKSAASAPFLKAGASAVGVVFDHQDLGFVSSGKDILLFEKDGWHKVWASLGEPRGHKIDGDGYHLICDAKQGAILRLSPNGRVLNKVAEEIESPFALALDQSGGIYFTALGKSSTTATGSVGYVSPAKISMLDSKLTNPRGVALSSDGKKLYVTNNAPAEVLVYECVGEGELGPRQVLVTLPQGEVAGDLAADTDGNLFVCSSQKVHVVEPNGIITRSINVGLSECTSLAFGGDENSVLFVAGALGDQQGSGAIRRSAAGAVGAKILADYRPEFQPYIFWAYGMACGLLFLFSVWSSVQVRALTRRLQSLSQRVDAVKKS